MVSEAAQATIQASQAYNISTHTEDSTDIPYLGARTR